MRICKLCPRKGFLETLESLSIQRSRSSMMFRHNCGTVFYNYCKDSLQIPRVSLNRNLHGICRRKSRMELWKTLSFYSSDSQSQSGIIVEQYYAIISTIHKDSNFFLYFLLISSHQKLWTWKSFLKTLESLDFCSSDHQLQTDVIVEQC